MVGGKAVASRSFGRRAASVKCLAAVEHGDELCESRRSGFDFFRGLQAEKDGILIPAVQRLEKGSGFRVRA